MKNNTISSNLSTKEVASLLHVTETTVKRWAEEGKIPHTKTLGGHRKFLMNDIVDFAEQAKLRISGLIPPPISSKQFEELEFGVQTRNYGKLSKIFFEEALQADRAGIFELLLYLAKHHIPFTSIADEIIRPAMVRIGELWESGKLEVNQEHRASQAITEAMIRLSPELHRKPSNGLSVVCACPEGEYHEIGLRSLLYSLETEGWGSHNIGANTPFDTLLSFVKAMRPELICLSLTNPRRKKDILEGLASLHNIAASYGAVVILGGIAVEMLPAQGVYADFVATSVGDAISYVKDKFQLKPGPKKHHAAVKVNR